MNILKYHVLIHACAQALHMQCVPAKKVWFPVLPVCWVPVIILGFINLSSHLAVEVSEEKK